MRNWAVRAILLVLAIAAQAVAAYLLIGVERQLASARQSARAFESATRTLATSAVDLRAAERALVAAGQGEKFWTARVDAIADGLADGLTKLQPTAGSDEIARPIAAAGEALIAFRKADQRARNYIRTDQRLLASDVIFADGLEQTTAIVARLDDARLKATTASDAAIADLERRRNVIAAGAAAFVLIVLIVLTPIRRGKERERLVQAGVTTKTETPEPARFANDPERYELLDAPLTPVTPSPAVPPIAPARPAVDLAAIGALCGDFAKLTDTRELPSLLGRAAQVLDASGVIVWMATTTGNELRPVLSHGYPPQTLNRLRAISRDAANPTAAAYRSGALQVVPGDTMNAGALAAPIITSRGCQGVMAAELGEGREANGDVQAAAIILAAQVATLVATGGEGEEEPAGN